jgi:hypothetical protein
MTPKPQANTLDMILAVGVPYMNEAWAIHKDERHHMLKGFKTTKGFAEAKQQLLAEVLDMIGENQNPNKMDGMILYADPVISIENELKDQIRKAAKERFK